MKDAKYEVVKLTAFIANYCKHKYISLPENYLPNPEEDELRKQKILVVLDILNTMEEYKKSNDL